MKTARDKGYSTGLNAQMKHGIFWIASGMSIGSIVVVGTVPIASALEKSGGDRGIEARRLQAPPFNLTGKNIFIGQVELSRPSKFGVDKSVNRLLRLDRVFVQPFSVFFRDNRANPNRNTDNHSHQVAAVTISRNKRHRGIAPNANLVSAAYSMRRRDGQPEAAIAAQHIARQNNGDVRAINFSFGEPLDEDPRPQAKLDGNALLTLCVDWLATTYNTLPVIAGNQGKGGIPIPTDQYNGITVGFTRSVQGVYRQLDRGNFIDEPYIDRNGNGRYDPGEYFTDLNKDKRWTEGIESPVSGRRSLSLLAPGNDIMLPDLRSKFTAVSGSSFAAPHVVGAIALLQEYADRQIASGKWQLDARRHEVTKAVLLNSADKIADAGDGKNLGMSKTILDTQGNTWLDSEAYKNKEIPLSLRVGAGQLNAFRALQQLQARQQSPGNVKALGWDFNFINQGQYREYTFTEPLLADSFVALTLTWDRLVVLNDKNNNRKFDLGESFRDRGVNNLDLYLMRSQDSDIANSVWSSVSKMDNTEHIFIKVPAPGKYKLRVVFNAPAANESLQRYAIAWWTATAKKERSP
jgi:subtilisin family serine protease